MLQNAPNIVYLGRYQSVCSSEDKYPSFIKKIYFSFSGFHTQKRIRLLRYDFPLSCKITCSKRIERDRHYTTKYNEDGAASHKRSNIPFSIGECLNDIAGQIEDKTMFSREQIRSGAASFRCSNAIDDRSEARRVSKVSTDNCIFTYFYARKCDRRRWRSLLECAEKYLWKAGRVSAGFPRTRSVLPVSTRAAAVHTLFHCQKLFPLEIYRSAENRGVISGRTKQRKRLDCDSRER